MAAELLFWMANLDDFVSWILRLSRLLRYRS